MDNFIKLVSDIITNLTDEYQILIDWNDLMKIDRSITETSCEKKDIKRWRRKELYNKVRNAAGKVHYAIYKMISVVNKPSANSTHLLLYNSSNEALKQAKKRTYSQMQISNNQIKSIMTEIENEYMFFVNLHRYVTNHYFNYGMEKMKSCGIESAKIVADSIKRMKH
jgi:hypothetical protein